MIRRNIAAVLLFSLIPLGAQSTHKAPPLAKHLTVDDIVTMVNAGISDDLVIAKLRKEDQAFDLTPDDLIRLKKAKVSDAILKFMMDPKAAPAAAPQAPVVIQPGLGRLGLVNPSGATPAAGSSSNGDSNDPMVPHDSGIYVYTKDHDGKPQLVVLERAAYQGAKTGGMLGSAMTYGIKKIKTKAVIPGPKASIHVNEASPVFYFYFDDKAAGLGKTYFGAGNLSNPNQFSLLRLEVNKSNRETTIGQYGALGSSSGSDSKSMIPFKSERIRTGLYKVTVEGMTQGEYCFLATSGPQITGPAAAYGMGLTNSTDIFDFSVSTQ